MAKTCRGTFVQATACLLPAAADNVLASGRSSDVMFHSLLAESSPLLARSADVCGAWGADEMAAGASSAQMAAGAYIKPPTYIYIYIKSRIYGRTRCKYFPRWLLCICQNVPHLHSPYIVDYVHCRSRLDPSRDRSSLGFGLRLLAGFDLRLWFRLPFLRLLGFDFPADVAHQAGGGLQRDLASSLVKSRAGNVPLFLAASAI